MIPVRLFPPPPRTRKLSPFPPLLFFFPNRTPLLLFPLGRPLSFFSFPPFVVPRFLWWSLLPFPDLSGPSRGCFFACPPYFAPFSFTVVSLLFSCFFNAPMFLFFCSDFPLSEPSPSNPRQFFLGPRLMVLATLFLFSPPTFWFCSAMNFFSGTSLTVFCFFTLFLSPRPRVNYSFRFFLQILGVACSQENPFIWLWFSMLMDGWGPLYLLSSFSDFPSFLVQSILSLFS